MKTNSYLRIRALTEGAIFVALAFVLSFVKPFELPNGGSLTPAMFPITVTKVLSEGCARMFDAIIEDNLPEYIREAVVIEKGHILNESTRSFRLQRGLAVK